MASISGSVSASFIPEHREAVKEVLLKGKLAMEDAARAHGFDGGVTISVTDGSGYLTISMSKVHVEPPAPDSQP